MRRPSKRQPKKSAQELAKEAEALKELRKTYAPQVLQHAQQLETAAKALMEINEQMHKDAIALTGDPNYKTNHIVSFERLGTMEQQEEGLGTIECPGFEDIAEVAGELICQAESALKEGR